MVGGSLHDYLRRLRQSASPGAGLGDGELLRRWVAGRDESAFEVLLWRHGPMVLSLCRRWLSRDSDAEDAFQATFFTLARKASSVRSGEGLAAWLHRVSLRICLRARTTVSPPPLEADVPDPRSPGPAEESSARELRAILDEEVNRLPERYRVPFVLCCLAGHSNAEAASQLGRPVGTIQSRLATARQRLRHRLIRRGVAPAAVAGLLTVAESARAALPAVLVSSTVQSAVLFVTGGAAAGACSAPVVALTEGVLKAMFTAKIKAAAAVVLSIALISTGGGVFGYRTFGPGSAQAEEGGDKPAAKPAKQSDAFSDATNAAGLAGPKEVAALHKQIEALRDELAKMRALLKQQESKIKAKEVELERALYASAIRQANRTAADPTAVKKGPATGFLPSFSSTGDKGPPQTKPEDPRIRNNKLPSGKDRPDAIPLADLRDSLELLKAQVAIKKAHLQAAMLEVVSAKNKMKRMQALHASKAVSQEELEAARAAAESAEAQIRIRQAELEESALRVRQVERRLKGNPASTEATGAARDKSDERLLHLEKKLTELLKEVQALRAEKTGGR